MGERKPRYGALIIGSLYWDQSSSRKEWRKRLDFTKKEAVRVPITYGRKSRTRENTYTMVFDGRPQCLIDGMKAWAVPFRAPIEVFSDLLVEMNWMWKAETNRREEKGIVRKWGGIAAHFFGPGQRPWRMRTDWESHVAQVIAQMGGKTIWECYVPGKRDPKGQPVVTKKGRLNVPIDTIEESKNMEERWDGLIATVNQPTFVDGGYYPDAGTVAATAGAYGSKTWKKFYTYFENTKGAGITTLSDYEIGLRLDYGPPNPDDPDDPDDE